MWLINWFKQIFVNKIENVEEHTLAIQKWIMQTTFLIFGGILIYGFYAVNKPTYQQTKELINVFLPLITAWIGAIIAFYFSKELANLLSQRIKAMKNKEKQTVTSINQMEKIYIQEKQQTKKHYHQMLTEMLIKLNKLEKNQQQKNKPKKNGRTHKRTRT